MSITANFVLLQLMAMVCGRHFRVYLPSLAMRGMLQRGKMRVAGHVASQL
jgi:hypothetical protein